jgi:hypothetical protein
MRITALSHPAFACDRCGSHKMEVPAEAVASTPLCCSDCGAVLGRWESFVAFVEGRSARQARTASMGRDPITGRALMRAARASTKGRRRDRKTFA